MITEGIATFVDAWAVAWSAVLGLGYLAELTPWPSLRVLRTRGVASAMLLSSAAVVFGLTLAGAREAAAVVTAWAVVISSVKLLYDWLGQGD